MRRIFYFIFFISIYLFSCSKSENETTSAAGNEIRPEDLLGRYCSYGLHVSDFNYYIEIIDSNTLFLNEPWTGNFKFITSQDALIIPPQVIDLKRSSPGGLIYTITQTIHGKGTYNSDTKTIIFEISYPEENRESELILTRFENIVMRGRYKSNESPNDSVVIRDLSTPDSLHVDLYFNKNEYGDTGFFFNAFQSNCDFQTQIFINDTCNLFVSIETIDSLITLRLSKYFLENEIEYVKLYSYNFYGYFVGE